MSDAAAPTPSAADLAALAVKAFAGAGGGPATTLAPQAVAAQPSAAQVDPAVAAAAASAAAATAKPAAPEAKAPDVAKPLAEGKGPSTLLSETPVAAVDPAKTAADVAAKTAVETQAPTYVLAPISERLSTEQVADLQAFAHKHQLSEAQARQVLAREDLKIAQAYDTRRAALLADPELGGPNIHQTIKTTQSFLQLLSVEDRKYIANLPIANDAVLHRMAKIMMGLIPQEDYSRRTTQRPAETQMSPGEAYLKNPKNVRI